jgi:hypothetical protein
VENLQYHPLPHHLLSPSCPNSSPPPLKISPAITVERGGAHRGNRHQGNVHTLPPVPSLPLPRHSRHCPQLFATSEHPKHSSQKSLAPAACSSALPTIHALPRDMIALQAPAELSCPPTPLTPSCCLPAAAPALNRKGLEPLFASAERFGDFFSFH